MADLSAGAPGPSDAAAAANESAEVDEEALLEGQGVFLGRHLRGPGGKGVDRGRRHRVASEARHEGRAGVARELEASLPWRVGSEGRGVRVPSRVRVMRGDRGLG